VLRRRPALARDLRGLCPGDRILIACSGGKDSTALAWALIQTLERKLDSIDHALRLARNGTYGICESCGERIDPARLEILPEATLCLNCQRQKERRNRRRRF
jgi:RNA polymerase-binding transcription factor DksA